MIRVLLVDDHAMVLTGLQSFLASAADVEVVATAANGELGVAAARTHRPDVVLMDLLMPVMGGIDAIRQIRAERIPCRIIALSTSDESRHVNGALGAGADGYLLKDVDPSVLLAGIRSVMQGGVPMSPAVTAAMLGRAAAAPAAQADDRPSLTAREHEVLRLIRAGRSNREIADELGIAEKTVKTHCTHLFQRIGVSDRAQAAAWAERFLS